MIRVDEREIEQVLTGTGLEISPGVVMEVDDELDARVNQKLIGGTIMECTYYRTPWVPSTKVLQPEN